MTTRKASLIVRGIVSGLLGTLVLCAAWADQLPGYRDSVGIATPSNVTESSSSTRCDAANLFGAATEVCAGEGAESLEVSDINEDGHLAPDSTHFSLV